MAQHNAFPNREQLHDPKQMSPNRIHPNQPHQGLSQELSQELSDDEPMTPTRFLSLTNFYTTDMNAVMTWAMSLMADRRVSPYIIRAAREFMLGNTISCIHCCESASMSYRKARHKVLSILKALDPSIYSKALKELPTS